MKIAIFDKDTVFCKTLKRILYAYSNAKRLDFVVETFTSGKDLLISRDRFVLIFIELSNSGEEGLRLAKQLQRQNGNAKIIFLSQDTSLIFEAFKVNVYRFLTKPLCEDKLFKALDELFFVSGIHYPLLIKEGLETHCIDTAEITYLEADNKYCHIHLCDNVILCKKTMARVYDALPKIYFHKINRSFVVNLNYINKYNSDSVFLKNGEGLHVTRTYFKTFKENYTEYSSPLVL